MAILNEERILDFLDGRLTSGQEEELLHTLAVSPERRGILRAHMRLREITSNIASADRFTVPKHVTSGLFRSLESMGLKATASTEEILTHAPLLAKVAEAGKVMSSAVAVGGTAGAVANAGGWQMSFVSIIGATLLSFTVGAGAYHVFANGLGVHPLGVQPAVQMAAQQQATTSILHNQLAASVSVPVPQRTTKRLSHLSPCGS